MGVGFPAVMNPASSGPSGNDSDREWLYCFWSYVRKDDEATFGKIRLLSEDLKRIYAMETGESLEIFFDRLSIGWGEQWVTSIADGIDAAVFMIPIVTPNYFKSDACRGELLDFYAKCNARGVTDLILPIVFSGRTMINSNNNDEVIRIIANAQSEFFDDVWPAERGSEVWASRIKDLVRKLVAAQQRVEDRLAEEDFALSGPPLRPTSDDEDDDDSAGILDMVEQIEPALLDATESLNKAASVFLELANILQEHSPKIQAANQDTQQYKGRLMQMAAELTDPAKRFEQDASVALEKIAHADTLMSSLYQSLGSLHDPVSGVRLGDQLSGMVETESVVVVESELSSLVEVIANVERLSVVVKKALRPARRGIRFMRDAARIYIGWGDPS